MDTKYYVLVSEDNNVLGIIKNDDLLIEKVKRAVKENEFTFDPVDMLYNAKETYTFLVDGEVLIYNLIPVTLY